MTSQQRTIWNTLYNNTNTNLRTGLSTFALASRTGFPEPSIRRSVGELRNLGYQIQHSTYRGYSVTK